VLNKCLEIRCVEMSFLKLFTLGLNKLCAFFNELINLFTRKY